MLYLGNQIPNFPMIFKKYLIKKSLNGDKNFNQNKKMYSSI